MPRWTVRGVTPEAITAVQHVQNEIGASLGEIVTACIAVGLGPARKQLEEQRYPNCNRAEIMALQRSIQRAIDSLMAGHQ